MSLRSRGGVLAAGGDPARGSLQAPRRKRYKHFLRKDAALGSKSTTHVLGHHPNVVLVDAERRRHSCPDGKDVLRRRPQLDPARVRVGGGRDRAWLHSGAGDPRRRQSDRGPHAVAAKAALVSPYVKEADWAMLDFISAWTAGALSAMAEMTSPTPGKGSSSGKTCSAASCAW